MKMARVALVFYPPGARSCCECLNGKAIHRNAHMMKCDVDGSVTFRNFPGHCEFFSEKSGGAKRRKAKSLEISP